MPPTQGEGWLELGLAGAMERKSGQPWEPVGNLGEPLRVGWIGQVVCAGEARHGHGR